MCNQGWELLKFFQSMYLISGIVTWAILEQLGQFWLVNISLRQIGSLGCDISDNYTLCTVESPDEKQVWCVVEAALSSRLRDQGLILMLPQS